MQVVHPYINVNDSEIITDRSYHADFSVIIIGRLTTMREVRLQTGIIYYESVGLCFIGQ